MDLCETYQIYLGNVSGSVIQFNRERQLRYSPKHIRFQDDVSEVTSMCLAGYSPSELFVGFKNGFVKTYDSTKETYKIDCVNQKEPSPIVGLASYADREAIVAYQSGNIYQLNNYEFDPYILSEDESIHLTKVLANPYNETQLGIGGTNMPIKIYDVDYKRATFTSKNDAHDSLSLARPNSVLSLSFFDNLKGAEIGSVTKEGQIRLYDPRAQRKAVRSYDNPDSVYTCIARTCIPNQFVVGNNKGMVILFDLRYRGAITLKHVFKGYMGGITDIVCAEQLPLVLSCSLDRQLAIQNFKDMRLEFKEYVKTQVTRLLLRRYGHIKTPPPSEYESPLDESVSPHSDLYDSALEDYDSDIERLRRSRFVTMDRNKGRPDVEEDPYPSSNYWKDQDEAVASQETRGDEGVTNQEAREDDGVKTPPVTTGEDGEESEDDGVKTPPVTTGEDGDQSEDEGEKTPPVTTEEDEEEWEDEGEKTPPVTTGEDEEEDEEEREDEEVREDEEEREDEEVCEDEEERNVEEERNEEEELEDEGVHFKLIIAPDIRYENKLMNATPTIVLTKAKFDVPEQKENVALNKQRRDDEEVNVYKRTTRSSSKMMKNEEKQVPANKKIAANKQKQAARFSIRKLGQKKRAAKLEKKKEAKPKKKEPMPTKQEPKPTKQEPKPKKKAPMPKKKAPKPKKEVTQKKKNVTKSKKGKKSRNKRAH